MKPRTFLGGSLLAALVLGTAGGGCGQPVPTCDSISALPGAPTSVTPPLLNHGGDNNVETTSVKYQDDLGIVVLALATGSPR
jgi:hypothetical protein